MTETLLAVTDPDWLRARVLTMIEDDGDIDPDEPLTHYGLDSMQVMQLSLDLEAAGVPVSFAELAETPTLTAWAALIASRTA